MSGEILQSIRKPQAWKQCYAKNRTPYNMVPRTIFRKTFDSAIAQHVAIFCVNPSQKLATQDDEYFESLPV